MTLPSENNGPKRNIYEDKKISGQPVKSSCLSLTNYGVCYFNFNKGSRMEDVHTISFEYVPEMQIKIKDLKDKRIGSLSTVIGRIKPTQAAEVKSDNGTTHKKNVRDAVIADETGYMPISIWADLIDSIEEDFPYKITEVSVRYFRQKSYPQQVTVLLFPLKRASCVMSIGQTLLYIVTCLKFLHTQYSVVLILTM